MSSFVSASTWAALSVLFFVSGASAESRTFEVDSNGGSRVQFVSDAPLETMTGVTSKLSGKITVDFDKASEAKATIDAEVASIRTGIDLRDEHLRSDNWLDAKRHPKATFEVTSISGIHKIEPNKGTTATVKGKFTIHGVTKQVTAKAKLRFIPESSQTKKARVKGDVLRVQASFTVELEDHKVSVPSIVRLKVANEIKVNVDLRATAR